MMLAVLDTMQIEIWNKWTEDLLIFSVIPDCNSMGPKCTNQPLKLEEKDLITIIKKIWGRF